jgi:hypothetical protein
LTRASLIKMPGVSVRLLDIYDRPLEQLNERILGYWQ